MSNEWEGGIPDNSLTQFPSLTDAPELIAVPWSNDLEREPSRARALSRQASVLRWEVPASRMELLNKPSLDSPLLRRFGIPWGPPLHLRANSHGTAFDAAIAGMDSETTGLDLARSGIVERDADNTWIAESLPRNEGKLYNPMRHATLAQQFSKIDSNEQALAFANRYGFLGAQMRMQGPQRPGPGEVTRYMEHARFWLFEARKVRIMLSMMDLAEAGERTARKALRGRVFGTTGAMNDLYAVNNLGLLIGRPNDAWLTETLIVGFDPASPVRRLLPSRGSDDSWTKYAHWAAVCASLGISGEISEGTVPVLWPRSGEYRLRPVNLLGAIYLQLARRSIGTTKARKLCAACGKGFMETHGNQKNCPDCRNPAGWQKARRRRPGPGRETI